MNSNGFVSCGLFRKQILHLFALQFLYYQKILIRIHTVFVIEYTLQVILKSHGDNVPIIYMNE